MFPVVSLLMCTCTGWALLQAVPHHQPLPLSLSPLLRRRAAPHMMADAFVLDRLKAIKASYMELEAQQQDPDAMKDTSELLRVNKEMAKIEGTVAAYDKYLSLTEALASAKELFQEADDTEMKELAREEMRESEAALAELDGQLKLLLLPTDPNDEKNVMLEIRAGTGGDEAAIWCADLLRIYTKYAQTQGWQAKMISQSDSEAGGCRDVTLEICGNSVYSKLKFEAGVHRVQRVWPEREQGRDGRRSDTHTNRYPLQSDPGALAAQEQGTGDADATRQALPDGPGRAQRGHRLDSQDAGRHWLSL